MSEIVQDLSSAALASALEANMSEFGAVWGRTPQGELYEGSDLIQFISGLPFPALNGTYHARLASETVDAAIERTLARVASRHVPMHWSTGPDTRPPNLGTYLERHGFIYEEESPGMAVDMLALYEDQPPLIDLAIEYVENMETLRNWARVAWIGFGFPETSQDAFIDLEVSVGVAPNESRRRYIGYKSGVPVATSALVLHAGVAGIFAVTTLPEFRRQGIGTALTLVPLLEAREMGYRVGTLDSSEIGLSVYRQLGFQHVCEISHYLWEV